MYPKEAMHTAPYATGTRLCALESRWSQYIGLTMAMVWCSFCCTMRKSEIYVAGGAGDERDS